MAENTSIFKFLPLFENAIELLAIDSCMPAKPREEWPDDIDYSKFNDLLAPLSIDDFEELVIGEQTAMNKIVQSHGLGEFHNLLNEIFDRGRHSAFFIPASEVRQEDRQAVAAIETNLSACLEVPETNCAEPERCKRLGHCKLFTDD